MSDSLWTTFRQQGQVPDCPVYDLHGHWGPFYGAHMPAADPAVARKAMDRAGVRLLVFCHHEALFSPEIGNSANIQAVQAMPDRLRAYCGINPNYPEQVRRDVAAFQAIPDIFVGFKLLADYHKIPVDDERYAPAWELADAQGLPVLLHTWGGSAYDGYEPVRRAVKRYPNARVLLGHSLHGDWDRAVRLVQEFPHVYLELTAVMDERGILERFVEQAGSRRIIFGTDFPWFSFHYYIGAILDAELSDEDCRNIFYRNARDILGPTLVPNPV